MTRSTQHFDFTALTLDERTLLAYQLWESIQHETEAMTLTDSQRAEIERRIADADADRLSASPWEAVKLPLRQRS